jgi:hypothetical protein
VYTSVETMAPVEVTMHVGVAWVTAGETVTAHGTVTAHPAPWLGALTARTTARAAIAVNTNFLRRICLSTVIPHFLLPHL